MDRYNERNIYGQRREQYGPSFPFEDLRQRADDLRRDLIIKYSVHPEELDTTEPRNLWREISKEVVDFFDSRRDVVGLDAGTSSGYVIDMLLEEGYAGQIYGVDIWTKHFPLLREWLDRQFPEAASRVQLGRADAESLGGIQIADGEFMTLPASSVDFSIVANVLHHTPRPQQVLQAVHRVTKKDGLVIFAGRNIEHLANLYSLGFRVANHFKTSKPQPFYHSHDFNTLNNELDRSVDYEVLKKVTQGIDNKYEGLWIPGSDEGWNDLLRTFNSLLPMMKKRNSKPLTPVEITDYMENIVKPDYFLPVAKEYYGYVYEPVAQGYLVCRVIK